MMVCCIMRGVCCNVGAFEILYYGEGEGEGGREVGTLLPTAHAAQSIVRAGLGARRWALLWQACHRSFCESSNT